MYCFLSFSDKRLAVKNFTRSQSLPFPQDYRTRGVNPILICLLDQMKADHELSEKYASQAALLDGIISALETERMHWPSDFNLISSEQWIQRMRADPSFHLHHAKNSSEMREYENLLLDFAAQCLKGEIQLIPFLEEKPSFTTGSRLFFIMACQTLFQNNFFLSIKKEQYARE